MSADWWLTVDDERVWSGHLTYNLNAMLYAAGWHWNGADAPKTSFPNSGVWPKEHLDGARASDLGERPNEGLRVCSHCDGNGWVLTKLGGNIERPSPCPICGGMGEIPKGTG